jgi:hypothetical protein
MKRIAVAAAAASLFVAVAGATPSSAAVPRAFYGIVPFAPLNSSDFVRMGQAKVGSLRFQITWSSMQQSRGGPINFAATDAKVAGAAFEGIEPFPTLFGTPKFESGCGSVDCQRHIETSKTALADWGAFVKAVANRYGTKGSFWAANPSIPKDPITRYQVWNEVNNTTQHNTPQSYTKLVKATDSALGSVDKKTQVILSGMFGEPPNNPKNDAWNYLNSMYKAGAGPHFDGAALHPYAIKPSGLSAPIKKMRAAMKKGHDASTPLYITEIGWGSSKKVHGGTGGRGNAFNVTPKKQAAYLKSSFKTLTSHRKSWKLGGVFWFTWKDPVNAPDGLCGFCYSSGLYKGNGTTAKPSLKAYESFTKKTKGKRYHRRAELPNGLRLVPAGYRQAAAGLL